MYFLFIIWNTQMQCYIISNTQIKTDSEQFLQISHINHPPSTRSTRNKNKEKIVIKLSPVSTANLLIHSQAATPLMWFLYSLMSPKMTKKLYFNFYRSVSEVWLFPKPLQESAALSKAPGQRYALSKRERMADLGSSVLIALVSPENGFLFFHFKFRESLQSVDCASLR